MAPVIDQCVSLLKATLPARVTVQASIARSTQPIMADASQMLQVLVNLGTNAAHAMQEVGGTVDIRVESVTVDQRLANAHPDLEPGKYARISVSDTGHGMDAATQLRIFEPFFTTKGVGEGTGLGLSVVHGIVASHGGVILVRSELNVGSTFELYLPAAEAAVENPDGQPEPKVKTKGCGQRILCIDDDEPLMYLLKRLLERQGYQVTGYTDAREALDAFQANPDAFDAVVTDYNMPGLSGLEVARSISSIRPNLPVAVASGFITDELKTQALALGVTDLIFKPNAVEEYGEVVARLVKRGS
jgi:CheY-like chemotaxis protein